MERQKSMDKKYQALFENSITGLFIIRPDGLILEANRAACRMFGYCKEEFKNLRRQNVIDANSLGMMEKLRERKETGSTSGELIAIRKNGEKFWCEFSSSVFDAPEGDEIAIMELRPISKEGEEKNRILESISDAFYAIDENWNITYFNAEAENLLNKKWENVVGESIWGEFPAAKETELYDIYHKVMEQKKPQSFEYYYPPLDSWYDISAYPAENGISVYFKNINERKEAQSRILEKTQKLDAIAQFNSLLIKEENWLQALDKSLELFGEVAAADRVYFFEHSVLDATGEDAISMKVEWVSQRASREIDNPDHQDLPFDDIRSFIDQVIYKDGFNEIVSDIEDQEFAQFLAGQKIKSILALPVFTGKEFRGFIGFDDCTHENIWTEEEITFLKTIAINLGSAIENEDAEKALQVAFEEKNTILESIGDCFFAVNHDWTVTYWNHKAEEVLGMPRERILGENLWDLYEDAISLEFYTQYHKAVREQLSVHFEEYYPTLEKWFEVSAYPSNIGLSVFFKDITERKETEDKLRRLNESLIKQADELAASNAELEQFAFVASHDLQEPLRMITSFLAQLEKKYGDELDDKAKKYIHFATDGAKRMRQIILDLLEYSRVGRVDTEREKVDIDQLLEGVAGLQKKLIEEKKAKVNWNNMPVIYASRGPIQQLFQNLVNNALNYQDPSNKPVVHIRSEETKTHWKFFVEDNGIGINPEYKDKIFNIFQRLHGQDEYSGTGVGLAICKKIVEELGGEIWVESELGKGSTFYFTIAKSPE